MVPESNNLPESDLALINAIKEQDKTVFEALYKQHYRKLYALAYYYLERHEIAEEMVHDVFINIWNKAPQLVIKQSVKSYLYRSVVNASLNFLKKEKTEAQNQDKYSQLVAENSNEEYEDKESLLNRLENVLEMLPPQCKKVMLMSRFEKMKQQDIADQLNISVKTVKNHLTYGFAKMRGALADGKKIAILFICVLLLS